MLRKINTYEVHPREYTILGMSAVFQGCTSQRFKAFFGANLSEIISVIKNGQFYHIQLQGEREQIARIFLQKINAGVFDFEKEYNLFQSALESFEYIISLNHNNYSLNTILDFYSFYRALIPYALLAFDTPDLVSVLDTDKREPYLEWVTNLRLRAERVYKDGEMVFIPRYLEWLVKNHLPNYTSEQLQYVFYTEIESYIKENKPLPSPKVLHERKQGCFFRQYPFEQYQLLQGVSAQREVESRRIFHEEQLKNTNTLKGQTAYPGTVTGIVRVIRKRADMQHFQDGDIIVSVMTDPHYLPIMKQAKAFVTDEGGLLCHAAIVARELQKPCITGTKHATKLLKNGDLVEVNATIGTITIL